MWLARVPYRTVLSVTGPDASKFLGGLLAASIPHASSAAPAPFYSAFINAQGRVLYDAFVYPHPTDAAGFLLDHDARESPAPPLAAMLKRFVLRSRVAIRPVAHEWDVWQAWGTGVCVPDLARRWRWARSGAVENVWTDNETPWSADEPCVLVDRRAPGMGRRMLVPAGETPREAKDHDAVDGDEYNYHRILNGVPEGVNEIIPLQSFPMESNLDIMGGVDFRKGCYVGQELTVRTYHTGLIRKRILPVRLSPPPNTSLPPSLEPSLDIHLSVPPEEQMEGDAASRPRPRATGKLLTTIPERGVGLALLRLEHLDAVERGDLSLNVDTESGKFEVQHWWPDWFPRTKQVGDEDAHSSNSE